MAKRIKVIIDGVEYPNCNAAARHFDVPAMTLRTRIKKLGNNLTSEQVTTKIPTSRLPNNPNDMHRPGTSPGRNRAVCHTCGKEYVFQASSNAGTFCSHKCYGAMLSKLRGKEKMDRLAANAYIRSLEPNLVEDK